MIDVSGALTFLPCHVTSKTPFALAISANLNSCLDGSRPDRIAELQSELAKVQQMFVWNKGVFNEVLKELEQHTSRLIASV